MAPVCADAKAKAVVTPRSANARTKVAAFLDGRGRHDLDQLKTIDAPWGELVEVGQPWELLDHQMDIEEPEAALVISIALNKRKTKPP